MSEPDLQDDQAEIDWQTDILVREFPERLGLTLLAFALCLIYIPPGIVALLAGITFAAEFANLRIIQDEGLRRSRRGYLAQLILLSVTVAGFTSAAGFVWMEDDRYAKAYAVGMVMSSLLHLATVRAIHLPMGLSGLAASALTVTIFDTVYWLALGNPVGLALSATSAFCALAYTFIAMLSNNRLHRAMRQQEARASRADAAKSRFLAVLSHELRTPLNAVLGMGHAALAEPRGAEDRETLGQLVAAARDMATILDDATDMSAIADGRFRLRERPADPAEELTAAVAPFRSPASRQRSELTLMLDPALPRRICLDPQRFRQCLSNLLANALKHAGDGPIRVTAGPSGSGFEVMVADAGPGLAEAEAEQVFEPFRRGRSGAQGAGLGLTISRSLARQMGGDVTLAPTPAGETGARFRLWLPLRPVPGEDASVPTGRPAATLPDLRGRSLLVVDDIATNRLVAAMHLRPSHARVIEAESGTRALEVLATDHVDLILLDLNMPGMDGIETVAAIRALRGRNARIPVVAMTADATAAEPLQMDGVLIKPLDPERLSQEINRHLGG